MIQRVLGFLRGRGKPVLTVLVVLAVGGLGFGLCKFVRYRLRTVPGTPVAELLVRSPAGATLITIDHVSIGGQEDGNPTAEGMRLTAIDARTGARLAVDVGDHADCWAAGPRMWCRDKFDQLHLLEPRTLETLASASELIERAGLAKSTRRYHLLGADERALYDAGDVIVVLEDGRGAQITPSTLAVTGHDTLPGPRWKHVPESRCATLDSVALGPTRLVLHGRRDARRRLTTEPPPPAESAEPVAPALTFLGGEFVKTDPQLPLVLHTTTVDGPAQLARVEGMSTRRWELGLSGSCRGAWLSDTTLVIATSDRDRRALGIDVASGAVVWTLDY